MINRLGGSNIPRLPDEVSTPKENFSLYPCFINTGSMSPPRARIVTPDPPVNVVKKAQTQMAATAEPPGIQPNQASNKRTRREDDLPAEDLLQKAKHLLNVESFHGMATHYPARSFPGDILPFSISSPIKSERRFISCCFLGLLLYRRIRVFSPSFSAII